MDIEEDKITRARRRAEEDEDDDEDEGDAKSKGGLKTVCTVFFFR